VATIQKQPEITNNSSPDPQISEVAVEFFRELVQDLHGAFVEQIRSHDPPPSSLDYPDLAKRAFFQVLAHRYGMDQALKKEIPKVDFDHPMENPEDRNSHVESASWAEQLRDYLVNPLP